MPKKIKISCANVQYERLIDTLKSYFEDGVCFLGRSYGYSESKRKMMSIGAFLFIVGVCSCFVIF